MDAEDYTVEKVKQEFGVRPDQIVDYKALIGDKSDNIPGVHGIGEKTARAILEKHPSLDEVYAHLSDYPERIQKLLIEGKKDAYLSYDLSRIRTDLSIGLDLQHAKVGEIHSSELATLFKELEFRSLLNRLQTPNETLPRQPGTGQPSLFNPPPIRISASPRYSIQTNLVDSSTKIIPITTRIFQCQSYFLWIPKPPLPIPCKQSWLAFLLPYGKMKAGTSQSVTATDKKIWTFNKSGNSCNLL